MGRDVNPRQSIPSDVESLADYERHAEAVLDPATWRHLQNGADAALTLSANRAAFDRLRFVPRALADLRGATTAIDLLGRRHEAPLMLAPIAYQRLAHPDGELAVIRAATASGIGMIVSTLASVTIEEIAAAMRAAARQLGRPVPPLWFQLYLQEERTESADLVHRAEAAGCEAIVVTVDAAIKRSGIVLPPGVEAANLRHLPRREQTTKPSGAILFGTPIADRAPRWEDIAWLRGETDRPLIVKGVLSPADIETAISIGADAIVISNHGGRVLDGLVSPMEVLPRLAEVARARVPLLLDSGVRYGTDLVKAIARGASAVLLGRPQMHALAVAGTAGVVHALHLLRAELELAMAQLGCATIADIGEHCLFDGA